MRGPAFSKSRNQYVAVFPCRDIGAAGSFVVYQPDLRKRKICLAAVGAFAAHCGSCPLLCLGLAAYVGKRRAGSSAFGVFALRNRGLYAGRAGLLADAALIYYKKCRVYQHFAFGCHSRSANGNPRQLQAGRKQRVDLCDPHFASAAAQHPVFLRYHCRYELLFAVSGYVCAVRQRAARYIVYAAALYEPQFLSVEFPQVERRRPADLSGDRRDIGSRFLS